MHQSKRDRVVIYLNDDKGESWRPQLLSARGSHYLRVADFSERTVIRTSPEPTGVAPISQLNCGEPVQQRATESSDRFERAPLFETGGGTIPSP